MSSSSSSSEYVQKKIITEVKTEKNTTDFHKKQREHLSKLVAHILTFEDVTYVDISRASHDNPFKNHDKIRVFAGNDNRLLHLLVEHTCKEFMSIYETSKGFRKVFWDYDTPVPNWIDEYLVDLTPKKCSKCKQELIVKEEEKEE